MLTYNDTKRQSEEVFNKMKDLWTANAKKNMQCAHRNTDELRGMGVGKVLVCVATGPSLEKEIETLKANRHKIDILACDKTFGILLDHGIKADYVNISDAAIPFRWLEKYVDETKGVKLISTPYANPEWVEAWKGDRYFFVNMDAIGTEKYFLEICGQDKRTIPAGSNVSNCMLVFMTGCNNNLKDNFSGYEAYLLVGYDFCWKPGGNYYAFNNPKEKRQYMHHQTLLDMNYDPVFTSGNLMFSAKWLHGYVQAYPHLNIINCSGMGLLDIARRGELAQVLKVFKEQGTGEVVSAVKERKAALEMLAAADKRLMAGRISLWQ